MRGPLTRSPVDVVQVASAVFVRPVTWFTVETRLSRTPAARVLDDHSLSQILVEFQVIVSTLHEFRGLW
jgi:hypothetical protein